MKNVRPILYAWVALLTLLTLTIAASFAPLGRVLPYVSYTIAIAKTALIVWLFMEMKTRDGLQRLALGVGRAERAPDDVVRDTVPVEVGGVEVVDA